MSPPSVSDDVQQQQQQQQQQILAVGMCKKLKDV
jgi:hypothetical protein